MSTPARFRSAGDWAFIPGPHELAHPIGSLDLRDIASYPPMAIAESILAFPGVRLLHPATPSWWEWRARWETDTEFIEVGMTLFDDESQNWGGSTIEADCPLAALEALWLHLQSRHPAVALHSPDCTIHTPDSLRRSVMTE